MTSKTLSLKQLIKAAILLVASLCIAGISSVSGLFTGMREAFSMIHFRFYSVVQVVLMVLLVLAVGSLLRFILDSVHTDRKRVSTMMTVLSSLISYAEVLIIICWGLTLLGVQVSTVFASVGILALVVGFGAEKLIADVVTGVFMIFENQYNVGDIIEVNGFRGEVKRIGIRTTMIAEAGDNVKLINNSDMKNVLNRSTDLSTAICDIGIPYEKNLEEVEALLPAVLDNIYKNHQDVMVKKPEYRGVQELAGNGVVLRFTAVVKERDIYDATRILNRELLLAWNKNHITPCN